MNLINRREIREYRNAFESKKGIKLFSEFVTENIDRSSRSSEVTVFLSHKHDEADVLKDAISLLKNHGVEVYIDHWDNDMPKKTCGETATKIKQKIRSNKKFILLATERAIASKWCNWELGYGDAHKYINHIALLIIKDNDSDWSGAEYLEIYPVIGKKYSWSNNSYEVEFPDGKTIDLDDWLKS